MLLLLLGLVFTIWWYIVSYLGVHLYSSFSRFTDNTVRSIQIDRWRYCVQLAAADVFSEVFSTDVTSRYLVLLHLGIGYLPT